MPHLKLLYTNFHAGSGGGHTTYVRELARMLGSRHEIHVAAPAGSRLLAEAAKLPGGVVLSGGGAQLKGIADYAKQALQLSARIGKPEHLAGVSEQVALPEFAVAVGLMLSDLLDVSDAKPHETGHTDKKESSLKHTFTERLTGIFGRFRS